MPRRRRRTRRFGETTRVKLIGGHLEARFSDPQGPSEVRRALEHFDTAARDFRPVWRQFGPYQVRSTQRTMRQEGRPQRWRPLAESTRRHKARHWPGTRILERTGSLRREWRTDYGPRSFRMWNKFWWWQVHQAGGSVIPQRIMLQLLPRDLAEITRLARRHLGG